MFCLFCWCLLKLWKIHIPIYLPVLFNRIYIFIFWKVYLTIDKYIHICCVPYVDVMFPMSIKHVTDIEAGLIFTSIWNEQKEMLSQKQSFYARFYSNRDCISPSMLSYYHFVLNDWIILLCILFGVLTVYCINEIQILD